MKTHKKQVITGPNENSQKASISVYVLTANSQDEVYEGTTRPRPEKRQANTKTRRRDEWHRNRRKKVSLFDTGGKSQTNPKCGVRVSNSEAGIVAPKQEATLRLRTSVQKETNLPHTHGSQHGRALRNETTQGNSDPLKLRQKRSYL